MFKFLPRFWIWTRTFSIKASRSNRGYSVFELALTLPVILFFAFGAIDVNNAVQSYTAAKQGVTEALRCLYTVNGRCVAPNLTPPGTTTESFWYSQCVTNQPSYLAKNYAAKADWLNGSTITYGNFTATVLGDARFTAPAQTFRAQFPYQASASFAYAMIDAHKPFVTGADPRNPNFVFLNSKGSGYSGSKFVFKPSKAVDRFYNFNGTNAYSHPISFKIPAALFPDPSAGNCFFSNNIDSASGHTPNFGSTCSTNSAEAVVHIKGFKSADQNSGRVGMGLGINGTDQGGQMLHDVGGPDIPREAANFFPRGTGPKYTDFDNDEFKHDQLTVTPDGTMTIDLSIDGDGPGTAGFEVTEVDVYISKFSGPKDLNDPALRIPEISPVSFDCNNKMFPSYFEATPSQKKSYCGIPSTYSLVPDLKIEATQPLPLPFSLGDLSFTQTLSTQHAIDQTVETLMANGYTTEQAQNLIGQYIVANQGDLHDRQFFKSCPAITQTENNGAANYGVQAAASPDGRIRNSSEANAICPVSDPLLQKYSIAPQNISWGEKLAIPPAPQSLSLTLDNCSKQLDLGAELSRYPKLTKPLKEVLPRQYFPLLDVSYSAANTPKMLHQNNPQFNCDGIQYAEMVFDENLSAAHPDSLFVGANRPDYGNCAKDEMRSEAVSYGMPSYSYYEDTSVSLGEIHDNCPPADSRFAACDPCRVGMLATPKHLVNPLPSQNPPAECASLPSGCACAPEFYSFGDGVYDKSIHYDAQAAKHTGFSAVKAAYPRATLNNGDCTGDDCVDLNVDTDTSGPRTLHTVQATIQTPMRLLLGSSVPVTYSASKVFEGDFAK